MDTLLYWLARALVTLIQALPLHVVARIGRAGGSIAFKLDTRHRNVVLQNLQMVFGGEKSPPEIHALARENFQRLGESYCCAVKTAAMSAEALRPHLEFVGAERLQPPQRLVMAIGHFGNFELFARFHQFSPGYQGATTYRALKHAAFNQLMHELREHSGCLFFERRTDGPLLRAAMSRSDIILGLFADQHAGKNGLSIPFFGRDCSTTSAPAVFALRYHCKLFTAFCFRVAPARWRFELGDEIVLRENDRARSTEEIMRDVNRSFEAAVRRDPANWFWVHRRWKNGG